MNWTRKCIVSLLRILLTASVIVPAAFGDHDEHKEKRQHPKGNPEQTGHQGKRSLKTVSNPAYKENCGACHFAYPPELLPSGSWSKILAALPDHFGESVEVDPEAGKTIGEYLRAESAESSSAATALKIMKSIRNQTPQRITEIPYIQKMHHEVNQNVFKRESIGSLSNCAACHTTVENGIFDDDYVKIPK
jgi:cytochrome c553